MSAPVYIQAGYAFRHGARLKSDLDPNAVGGEIAALRDEKGIIKVGAVVDAARPVSSAMHPHFTWDKDEAAQKCWEDEARYLLRSVVPVYADTRTEDEYVSPQRVFVAVYNQTNDTERAGEYQMLTVRTDARPAPSRPVSVAAREPEREQEDAVLLAPPPAALLTAERERALSTLQRWADAYGSDPYFAGVVAAIRLLG